MTWKQFDEKIKNCLNMTKCYFVVTYIFLNPTELFKICFILLLIKNYKRNVSILYCYFQNSIKLEVHIIVI